MTADDRPRTITRDGKTLVSRAWIREHTGASDPTVRLWYAKRDTQPREFRHPEKAATVDRVDYYDQAQFEKFYDWHQDSKKNRLLPTDPALYVGDRSDWVSINDATAYFHFAGGGVIRGYLRNNPGYFPEPVGTVEGPSGRQIPAFARGDLQDFDARRTGDNTGKGGRRPGHITPEVQQRIDAAVAYLKGTNISQRGAAAELAARHDEAVWLWDRPVHVAREQLGEHPTASVDREEVARQYLREHGYRRGVGAALAAQHGGSERTWQSAVRKARELSEQGQGERRGQGR